MSFFNTVSVEGAFAGHMLPTVAQGRRAAAAAHAQRIFHMQPLRQGQALDLPTESKTPLEKRPLTFCGFRANSQKAKRLLQKFAQPRQGGVCVSAVHTLVQLRHRSL